MVVAAGNAIRFRVLTSATPSQPPQLSGMDPSVPFATASRGVIHTAVDRLQHGPPAAGRADGDSFGEGAGAGTGARSWAGAPTPTPARPTLVPSASVPATAVRTGPRPTAGMPLHPVLEEVDGADSEFWDLLFDTDHVG